MTTAQKLTFKDYLSYVDGIYTPYELVDGELIPMALGTGRHGAITEFLYGQFRDEIQRQGLPWTAKAMMVGVRWSETGLGPSPRGRRWDTSRIPDITVLPQTQWHAMAHREAVIDLHESPPLLVVEVVSPSTETDDYRSKRSEYGLLEIPEHWIVDPIQSLVTLCVLDHQFYDSAVFHGNDLIQSPTFPHLDLAAAQILTA